MIDPLWGLVQPGQSGSFGVKCWGRRPGEASPEEAQQGLGFLPLRAGPRHDAPRALPHRAWPPQCRFLQTLG